jgi:uncharacterized protein YndB with AHSA1/START domain
MKKSEFVHVTYIRTTPEALWQALTDPDLIRRYFSGTTQQSKWKPGSSWRMVKPDGGVTDSGEILEAEPGRKLVLKWRHELRPELKAEGYSRMTYEIEEEEGKVKLTVTHEIEEPESKFIEAVSGGWPYILSSLKSLLETGEPLAGRRNGCEG